ncbi:cyclin-J18-like isoform X2 [Camellia sinensis]|nr:cyclin-J18-like isoform X2 [Camellia sinensis]
MHDSHPLSVKCLKSLGDKMIKEQHFTTHDFLEAEVVLMQGIATVGKLVNFEACMDIMELLYEKDQTSALYNSPKYLAASILVASYVITVPKQRWEFPVLPWDAYKMIGSNHESGPRGGFTRPDHMKCCGLERSSSLPSCCTVSPLHC